MSVTSTVLFDVPQQEVASLIRNHIDRSTETSIVSGFATPGGLAAIAAPITRKPQRLKTLIVGAATYAGFSALDDLITAGVPANRLYVHLGYTTRTGGTRPPFIKYHPMLHSKVYYTEHSATKASAFIGSHNLTSFALAGLNGEAAVMLEGPRQSLEFEKIRNHITAARSQAVQYSSAMREAYAWWTREFFDGLKSEVGFPSDWSATRTIIIFASVGPGGHPRLGDQLYFEIPDGIEKVQTLSTETHLFLFSTLPADPMQALSSAGSAIAHYTCRTLGAENRQGNREVAANWRLDGGRPILTEVPSGVYRPNPQTGMQQVRAEILEADVSPFEYLFERERVGWDPILSDDEQLSTSPQFVDGIALIEARGGKRGNPPWKLVMDLAARVGPAIEKDEAALRLARPEAGSFVLVSVRRRRKD